MRLLTIAVAAGSLAVGGVVAAAGYEAAVAPTRQITRTVAAEKVQPPEPEVKVVKRFRACKAPARLVAKKCVTYVAPPPVVVYAPPTVSHSGGGGHHTTSHHGDDDDHETEDHEDHEDHPDDD